MDIYTIDFETYYSREYGLGKLTTEEYIRDGRFEVIGVAVRKNDEETEWFTGTHAETKAWLDQFPWEENIALAHNGMFDFAIMSWHFGIKPKKLADTLCMARAIHSIEVGGSLSALVDYYGLGKKGTEVVNALGLTRRDFPEDQLAQYGEYCRNDVNLTYDLFKVLVQDFPVSELNLIDLTLRMFTEPVIELDKQLLEDHLTFVKKTKETLMGRISEHKDDLMSNPKFAEILIKLGVTPPTKISPTTGKESYAFAKSDEAFKALLEHEDTRVQELVSARLGVKSTLEETRTQRFIDIADRGKLPIPLRYYAAHTGRWGGDDKVNLQNLPRTSPIKNAMLAPLGHMVIDCDSSQIEARTLAWLAEQNDLVDAFDRGEDVYKIMASSIYGKPVDEITKDERFVGKTTILGCIAEGTPVLSDSGWKPIEQVSTSDKLWDGEEWVCHQGLVPKGMKETWSLCGSWLTPDHKILCGTEWKETQSVVQDENTLYQALETGQEKLPSQVSCVVDGVELRPSLLNVIAGMQSTQSTDITLRTSKLHGVPSARGKRGEKNGIGNTPAQCPTTPIELDSLTGYLRRLLVAITPSQSTTYITDNGALAFMGHGEKTEQFFSNTSKHWMDGITQSSRWIESTMTKGMNPTIFGSLQGVITCGTNVKSQTSKRLLQTYDLAYAGPRNRFTILTEAGPMVAHNCGYGMGAKKFRTQLKTFGVDLPQEECERIIYVYRETYPQIPLLWRTANQALLAIMQNQTTPLGRGLALAVEGTHGIRLPNGFYIKYPNLRNQVNDDGRNELVYDTKKGRAIIPNRIYGGKVVENVCQALARIVIGEQMLRVARKYRVVMTVHDAVCCVVPEHEADTAREYVEMCMRMRPKWALELPLDCESGVGDSYGDCK